MTVARVTVKMYSPLGVQEAYAREGASLPLRINDRKVAVFFPEDDEYLVARVTPAQADYLLQIPGFSTDGSDTGRRPSSGVSNWHEEGEKRITRNRTQMEHQAQSAPGDFVAQLFGSNPDLAAALIQAIAGKVSGSEPTPVAAPVVTHNIDIYEMMDLVDSEEALLLLEEFDGPGGLDPYTAPRSAIYTRLVRLADENVTLFERLNRRRAPQSSVGDIEEAE